MLSRSRIAVSILFFVLGLNSGAWVARLPTIKSQLGLSHADLGFVLFCQALGLLLALPLCSVVIARFGSTLISWIACVLASLTMVLIGVAPNMYWLGAILFIYGVLVALQDIAINAQGVLVEQAYQRRLMSSMHALVSLGVWMGSLLAGLAAAIQMTIVMYLLLVAALSCAATLWVKPLLIPTAPRTSMRRSWMVVPHGKLLPAALILLIAGLTEGAMYDWSATYLHEVISTSEAVAAWGFSVFALAMMTGRLIADRIVDYVEPYQVVCYSALLACGGFTLTVLSSGLIWVLLGYLCIGLGLCCLFPLIFSEAGKSKEMESERAIAAVATLGYLGIMVGPGILGIVAQISSLRFSFALLASACLLMVWLSKRSFRQK